MPLLPFLKVQNDVVLLHVKVQPRASRDEIAEVLGSELKIRVTAPPVDSAANEALVRFLADRLELPRSAVQIVRGETSRHKIIGVRGLSPDQVERRLGVAPGSP